MNDEFDRGYLWSLFHDEVSVPMSWVWVACVAWPVLAFWFGIAVSS